MGTRFELLLCGEDAVALRAAGEEALNEIERLEAQLSLYRADSEISRINARAAHETMRVEPLLFRLLQLAQRLSLESGGTFDITVAPLMKAWGFVGGTGKLPEPAALAEARACVGMQHVLLDEENFTIRFDRPGVRLDLGSIGKGYALEQAADFLREAGMTQAILHGGTSTVCAIGQPPDAEAWNIVIQHPQFSKQRESSLGPAKRSLPPEAILATIPLVDEALSVSAVWGKSFIVDGRTYGHVLDPRTGEPTTGALLAAVVSPSATETDALSTALLTLGAEGIGRLAGSRKGMRALVVSPGSNEGEWVTTAQGIQAGHA